MLELARPLPQRGLEGRPDRDVQLHRAPTGRSRNRNPAGSVDTLLNPRDHGGTPPRAGPSLPAMPAAERAPVSLYTPGWRRSEGT